MITYINRFNAAKGVVELHRRSAPDEAPQPWLLVLLKRWGEKMTGTLAKLAALDKIIAAVRAYLPPDGMTKDEFISTVIEAVDNPEFNEAHMNDFIRVSDTDIGSWATETPTTQLRFRKQEKGNMIMLEQLWEIRTQNSIRGEWRVVPIVDADAPTSA